MFWKELLWINWVWHSRQRYSNFRQRNRDIVKRKATAYEKRTLLLGQFDETYYSVAQQMLLRAFSGLIKLYVFITWDDPELQLIHLYSVQLQCFLNTCLYVIHASKYADTRTHVYIIVVVPNLNQFQKTRDIIVIFLPDFILNSKNSEWVHVKGIVSKNLFISVPKLIQ